MSRLSKLLALLPSTPPSPSVQLAAGDTFFVRRIPLAPDADPEEQVELALEGLSPFSPSQLYWGSLVSENRAFALVYAVYRKRISTEDWEDASAVLPEFLCLCGPREGRGASLEIYRGAGRITGIVRDAECELPAAVFVRADTDAEIPALASEMLARAGLDAASKVREVSGMFFAEKANDGALTLSVGGEKPLVLAPAFTDTADVRDDDFLELRHKAGRRDKWLWHALQGAVALLLVCAIFDITAGVMKWRAAAVNRTVLAQTPEVQRIETAQTLSTRIAELGERRLMPIEMLATINPGRPASIIFQRTVTRGVNGLDIEARTGNAGDIGAYEGALRALPAVASVETRDIRARDGQTSFVLSLDFKPNAFAAVEPASNTKGDAL